MTAAAEHAEAAAALLAALDADGRRTATRPFDHADRTHWHYVPRRRPGLALADMDVAGHRATHRLLATGLSDTAYAAAAAIIALDDVLDRREGHRRGRHSRAYAVLVAGDPGADVWGWRVEGHHLSVHVTVVDGDVRCGPQFLGANPARTTVGGHPTVQPLAAEEEVARALLHALPADARRQAVLERAAPDDILTTNERQAADVLEPRGVAGSDLGGTAGRLLETLVGVYVGRLPAAVAAAEATAARAGDVWFAWAGGPERGEPHYYRVQGPTFLVEYDNTQDGANHVHTVWRSRAGDFGDDLLARHRADDHGAG